MALIAGTEESRLADTPPTVFGAKWPQAQALQRAEVVEGDLRSRHRRVLRPHGNRRSVPREGQSVDDVIGDTSASLLGSLAGHHSRGPGRVGAAGGRQPLHTYRCLSCGLDRNGCLDRRGSGRRLFGRGQRRAAVGPVECLPRHPDAAARHRARWLPAEQGRSLRHARHRSDGLGLGSAGDAGSDSVDPKAGLHRGRPGHRRGTPGASSCGRSSPTSWRSSPQAFLFTAIFAILTAAGLAFLGLANVSEWSWGTMLYWAQNDSALQAGAWWWFVPPGLCIALVGSGLALLNFGFDEMTNPRLRSAGRPHKKPKRGQALVAPVPVQSDRAAVTDGSGFTPVRHIAPEEA